jgi:hypothetical protein
MPSFVWKVQARMFFTNILYLINTDTVRSWSPTLASATHTRWDLWLPLIVLIATTCFSIFPVRIMSCLLFSYTLKLSDSLYIINWFFVWRDEIQEAQTTDYCTTSTACSVPTEHTLCKDSVNSWSLNNFRIYAIQVIKTNEHNFSFS